MKAEFGNLPRITKNWAESAFSDLIENNFFVTEKICERKLMSFCLVKRNYTGLRGDGDKQKIGNVEHGSELPIWARGL
jgi:hypothetical protein